MQGALGTVLERSRQLCLSIYQKERLTPSSSLEAAQRWQLALPPTNMSAFAALYTWRDGKARQLDESTGYVLPKGQLIALAQALPTTAAEMQKVLGRSACPCALAHLGELVECCVKAKQGGLPAPAAGGGGGGGAGVLSTSIVPPPPAAAGTGTVAGGGDKEALSGVGDRQQLEQGGEGQAVAPRPVLKAKQLQPLAMKRPAGGLGGLFGGSRGAAAGGGRPLGAVVAPAAAAAAVGAAAAAATPGSGAAAAAAAGSNKVPDTSSVEQQVGASVGGEQTAVAVAGQGSAVAGGAAAAAAGSSGGEVGVHSAAGNGRAASSSEAAVAVGARAGAEQAGADGGQAAAPATATAATLLAPAAGTAAAASSGAPAAKVLGALGKRSAGASVFGGVVGAGVASNSQAAAKRLKATFALPFNAAPASALLAATTAAAVAAVGGQTGEGRGATAAAATAGGAGSVPGNRNGVAAVADGEGEEDEEMGVGIDDGPKRATAADIRAAVAALRVENEETEKGIAGEGDGGEVDERGTESGVGGKEDGLEEGGAEVAGYVSAFMREDVGLIPMSLSEAYPLAKKRKRSEGKGKAAKLPALDQQQQQEGDELNGEAVGKRPGSIKEAGKSKPRPLFASADSDSDDSSSSGDGEDSSDEEEGAELEVGGSRDTNRLRAAARGGEDVGDGEQGRPRIKPFDYAAARGQMQSGGDVHGLGKGQAAGGEDEKGRKKGSKKQKGRRGGKQRGGGGGKRGGRGGLSLADVRQRAGAGGAVANPFAIPDGHLKRGGKRSATGPRSGNRSASFRP